MLTFAVVGEITAGNVLGSIYLGRGREPNATTGLSYESAMTIGVNTTTDQKYFVRDYGLNALDAGAFHYSVYRYMARFLGMHGNMEAGYDLPTDWVDMWDQMILTNDFLNAYTGKFDPRHLYGVGNQDVFRWPTIIQGTEKMLLGYFITTFLLPGSPLVYYGEEQNFYVLDNTADNYVFGRQAMAPSPAWKAHGCYNLSNSVYATWPIDKGSNGCNDETVAYDHRDPSAMIRNIMKRMFAIREQFPVIQDGFQVVKLANQTNRVWLTGSDKATEMGIWSVAKSYYSVQNLTGTPVWLIYHNMNATTTYQSDCTTKGGLTPALLSPFDWDTPLLNVLSDDAVLDATTQSSFANNYTGTGNAGCFANITLKPFEFRLYVPSSGYIKQKPMITKFTPGHDIAIDTTNAGSSGVSQNITIQFSAEMNCSSINENIWATLTSTIATGTNLTISDKSCTPVTDGSTDNYIGYVPSAYQWSGVLQNVQDGIVKITLNNATSAAGNRTNSIDHFLLRFGKLDNPVVWPTRANYSRNLLITDSSGNMNLNHSAPGATKWRYSTNWGSTWSAWANYTTSYTQQRITAQAWAGTTLQAWEGKHVQVQYWSKALGSSAFIQHSDSSDMPYNREFPHVHLHGAFNKWGYDAGLPGSMAMVADNTWELHFMGEWPVNFQVNVWGINPDNQPDQTFIYGDLDNDGILDRLPPSSLSDNVVNITEVPPLPYLSWRLSFNDATWRFEKLPQGHVGIQIFLFFFMFLIPVLMAFAAGWVYVRSFYQVKVNQDGFKDKGWLPLKLAMKLDLRKSNKGVEMGAITPTPTGTMVPALGGGRGEGEKRTILIATMEYNIDDFKIKIKIGGLGVMAQLMAASLSHLNVVWVVPVVGDIDYPFEKMQAAESMFVDVMGSPYEIQVYYYVAKNITYVILDAPIFRKQTKADPYIARMDDIESAILYAAWNYCIAQTMRRFPIDVYHINDYHGAAAPLYLLPQTIPCCLSLHNAEFQGMWPMRTPEESKEVCEVFNLPPDVVKEYVQYGSVFNLLHAGASYLRVHQRGFGAVGVSRKYGDRSLARYPIFWSLKNIGQLPNPDPSDTAEWDPNQDPLTVAKASGVEVNETTEAQRGELRRKAQEWAGLEVDPNAELFVFVGRWSLQKGVDLIADIFPSILEKYPTTQLICIGPVIDLYGRFAALKLDKLMKLYPKRVYSKPEFTQLPPYIFSGAEFALIPSRDEPFGLVAVEFGRKGALGVGARVGGLGQMPGFWFTIESMSPSHLLQQFRQAITSALECK
jgi:alpha-1,3-glucan synthase